MLHLILLILPGVFSDGCGVKYPDPICAARGSDVTINCTFIYPSGRTVQQVKWCSMNSNSDVCLNGPYVYDSKDKNMKNNFQYIGDNSSDCSLLIRNIKPTDSGEYRFRFITNVENDKYTGVPGVNIKVQDLKVSMSSSRENGSTMVGDSVNLTCSLNCSAGLADVQWFKNGDLMNESKPVLIFTTVTAGDSGSYSCSLRNFKNTSSGELTIHIEDVHRTVSESPTILIIVVFSVGLVCIIAFVMLLMLRRGKPKPLRQPMEGVETGSHDNIYQTTAETQTQQEAESEPQEAEVQYVSVNFKAKETVPMSLEMVEEEVSTIYSSVLNR